jgi:hypothetical protein
LITYNRKIVKIVEYWFDEDDKFVKPDVVRYIQRSTPVTGIKPKEFYTILIDLRENTDVLLSAMRKDTRYEIRRASEKDGIIYEYYDTQEKELIDNFVFFYNNFASKKGIQKINSKRLIDYALNHNLALSVARSTENSAQVWHVYFRDNYRSRLLFSASNFRESSDSSFRNYIGRANRFHHWQDMMRLKKEGVSIYDFGGWYSGSKDQAKLDINKFKEGFGGQIKKNFNQEVGITLIGNLYLLALRVREKLEIFQVAKMN